MEISTSSLTFASFAHAFYYYYFFLWIKYNYSKALCFRVCMEDVAPAKCLIPLVLKFDFIVFSDLIPAVPCEVILLYHDIHPLQFFAGFPRGVGEATMAACPCKGEGRRWRCWEWLCKLRAYLWILKYLANTGPYLNTGNKKILLCLYLKEQIKLIK